MVAQDLAARLLEAAEARSHSPNAKYFSFWGIALLLLLPGMQVNGCASIALENERHSGKGVPVVAISLSLRSHNEIDELLFAVHVELPIDIAPVGDGGSFRYNQFFLNAREGVALRKNDENLEFSGG